jgi:hypothetical protein
MHLKNLERILKYTLKETSGEKIIDTLYEKTKFTIEQHITKRDVENFVAYLQLLSEYPQGQKCFKLGRKQVQNYVNRIYSECDHKTRYLRANNLYNYFENMLGRNIVLDNTEVTVIYKKLSGDKRSSIEKIMCRVCIAMILKWLQGFLQDKLSEGLHNHIVFLASIYGMYGTNRVFNVDWQPYSISGNDAALIESEYPVFETAITDAIKNIKKASIKKEYSSKREVQFQFVLSSIDRLITMSKKGLLGSGKAFMDKITIAASLIYLQDEFVEKNSELRSFINLIVSFYYQFRDKRYIPVFTN